VKALGVVPQKHPYREGQLLQGSLPTILGLPLGWMGTEVHEAMALVGVSQPEGVGHRAHGFRHSETYITAFWHGCGDLPLP